MGGPVCLDFINTLDDRFSNEPKELLKSYIDLVRFGEDTGILGAHQADHFLEKSVQSREAAEEALTAAIELREAMHEVFWSLIQKKPVPKSALFVVNTYAQEAARHMNVAATGKGFEWRFEDVENFNAAWWPIARSAVELLASDQLQFVRACASKTCQWLFLDESKNHRRRWCDMTKCGNRAKVKNFYTRQRKR
ncbi:MAG TPA: ABATE domain-containing protein [Candidatus Binatia bacterium]|nr:ABATE domain-containing protein [Candidatus Binatia bacterium]